MDIGTHYKILDNINVDELVEVVKSSTEETWNRNTIRQDIRYDQKDTKAIVLRFCPSTSLDFTHYKRDYPEFDILQPLLDHISSFYGQGGFVRVIITKLAAGKSVLPHIDAGRIYDYVHRIHVVIITNDNVAFFITDDVDGKPVEVPFAVGDIVEINNRWTHEVHNKSDSDRMHLIVDYITDKDVVKFKKKYGR